MEAVPRLPMISFVLKESPEAASFGPKLKQYIRDFYNEDPESYNTEIHQIETLRAAAVRPPINVNGCSLLKRYYCQLHFLQSRFPMGKDAPAAVNFVWKDLFSNNVYNVANVRFEIVSILYNIGAMHTQLGAHAERTSTDGMKMACTHFQCAAWAFETVKNSYPQLGVDLHPELMNFNYELCLAQAQECILEKSMLDNRKPTIVAKVAKQIVDYYSLALITLEQAIEGVVSDIDWGNNTTRLYKTNWRRYIKFKKTYHMAVTQLYQGLAAEEQQKMGERVAFYNASLASLQEARSIFGNGKVAFTGLAGEKKTIEEALTFTNDVIEGKRKAAKNENEYIYHEEVPDKDSLATVKGASLVKGISFNVEDVEVSGPDIFARLVPMKVHEASSLYSEEKAKILRSVGAKIEERDQQLNIYLTSLKLEHLSLWDLDPSVHEQIETQLPDELIERCAAISARPNAIQDLIDAMKKLSDTYQDVEAMLKDINVLLAEEQIKESKYQEVVGKRPPSIVATDFTREAKKYEEAHSKASESNQALHQAMTLHIKYLKILAQPLVSLAAQIPSIKASISEIDSAKLAELEAEKQHTKELKRILGKVDEMRKQRIDLHEKLRDAIAQDDVTRLLVTATAESENLDRIFSEQINKHQSLVNLIDQNLAAQDNILAALTDAYAQTANVRKMISETVKRRDQMISSLITSYDAYEDLLSKSTKGLEFYRKLEINVAKLLQRVKSTCKVQEEERVQILAQNSKTTTNVTDGSEKYRRSSVEYPQPAPSGNLKLKDYLNSRTTPAYTDRRLMNPTATMATTTDGATSKHEVAKVAPPTETSNLDYRAMAWSLDKRGYVLPYHFPNKPEITPTNGAIPMYPDISSQSNPYGHHNVMPGYSSFGIQDQQPYPSQSQSYIPPTQPIYTNYQKTSEPMMNYSVSMAYPENPPQSLTPQPSHIPQPSHTPQPSHIPQPSLTPQPPIITQQTLPPQPSLTPQPPILPQQTLPPQPSQNTQSSLNSQPPTMHPYEMQPVLPISETPTLVNQSEQYLPQYPRMSVVSMDNPPNVLSATVQWQQPTEVPQPSPTSSQSGATRINVSQEQYSQPQGQQYPDWQQSQPVASSGTYLPYQNTYAYGKVPDYSANSEIIQSHTKAASQVYVNNYIGKNYGQSSYQNYDGYSARQTPSSKSDSYQGHPGYSFDASAGNYSYSSGYQDQGTGGDNSYSNSKYTSAGGDAVTSQTLSSEYAQNYNSGTIHPAYYTTQYGLQQNHGATVALNNVGASMNQTYMQASNNSTNTTSSGSETAGPEQSEKPQQNQQPPQENQYIPEESKQKSNVDLLSDLDITINQAPLLPQIPVSQKHEEKGETESENNGTKSEASGSRPETPYKQPTKVEDSASSKLDDNLQIVWDTWYTDVQPKKDPLGDPQILQKFIHDIEKFEKFVDSLSVKTLSGATNLDIKWKEILDHEERENTRQTTNTAKLYPLENRSANCIPYDSSRVEVNLPEGPTYINASHVKDITQWTPVSFIVTQTPTLETCFKFWTMVWERDSEVIACLLSDNQLTGSIYWPNSAETPLKLGNIQIQLKNQTNNSVYIRRTFSMSHESHKKEREVVHMQFLKWPPNGFPSTPGSMLSFAMEVMSEQALRHCAAKPVIVHCMDGGSVSGLFLLATAAICHVRVGRGIVEVPLVFSSFFKYRKVHIDKDSLYFGYKMVLYHAQDTLMKRGILSSTKSSFECFEEMKKNKDRGAKIKHPSDDFLHNLRGSGLQGNDKMTASASSTSVPLSVSQPSQNNFQATTDRTTTDPLNELDPLWSIRR